MATHNHAQQNGGNKIEAVGVAAAAAGVVAAAAAGVYFLYGSKNAKKYRSVAKSWIFKAKSEILERLEKLEGVTEQDYNTIVDGVVEKYKAIQNVDASDVAKFVGDIKKQWKTIKKQVSPAKKKKVTRAKAK